MPLSETSLESADEPQKVREGILKALASKGYKVKQDTPTKIVAKHGFSATYYPHVVEIDLLSPQPSETGRTTITLKIDGGASAHYLRELSDELAKAFQTIQRASTKTPLDPQVNRAILWQKDETLVHYENDVMSSIGGNRKGSLIVTNQRVILACKTGFFEKDYAITYAVNLPDIMSVSSAGKWGMTIEKLAILEQNGRSNEFVKDGLHSLIPMINTAISERRSLLETQRDKEHIQVVLDFSSLRDVLAKGGVVMSSYNCPKCNAMIEIPEAGKVMICKYCGAPIKPIDIFDRIKSLL